MTIYNISGENYNNIYDVDGNVLNIAFDIDGNIQYSNEKDDGIKRNLKNVKNYPDWYGYRVGEEYVETFVAKNGYTLEDANVSVVMNGEDITDSVYNMGAVVIDNVSDDLSISIEAKKINYVIPTANDFTLELYSGQQAIKAYNGTETCVEIPSNIIVDGKSYKTCLYNTTIPSTVEHLKLSCAIPAYGNLKSMCSKLSVQNLKTFWNNTSVVLDFGTGTNAERIICPNQTSFSKIYTPNANNRITTLRQLEYPTSVNSGATLFYQDSAVVDAGTIPAWWESLHFAFNGCTSLRRIAIDAKNITNHGNWVVNVPVDCKVRLHPDSETFKYMRSQAVKGSGSGYAQPILRLYPYDETEKINTILCIGDSLTRGVGCNDASIEAYPVKLLEKLSDNTIAYNEGIGSTTVEWHRDKVLNEANAPYLNDSLLILWTGTNGNGSGDNSVETLRAMIEEMIGALGDNNKFLLVPAVAAALGIGETEIHKAHKQWCREKYGEEHVFDVYELFTSLGLNRDEYLVDSLHYSAEGYAIVANGMFEKLMENGWVTPSE